MPRHPLLSPLLALAAAAFALAALALGHILLARTRELGAPGLLPTSALALTALAALAALTARRALRRGELEPFPVLFEPQALRLALLSQLILIAPTIFGARQDASIRAALHIAAAALLPLAVLLAPARAAPILLALRRPALRLAELLLCNLALALLAAELTLRIIDQARGAPAWAIDEDDPFPNKLQAPLFGFPLNSRRYNDREFIPEKKPNTLRLAAIGDSFFVAQVPRPFGVIARAESLLQARDPAIEIYNFGIVATGPQGYLRVLEQEALELRPDLVLLGIYIGNDIRASRGAAPLLHKSSFALYRLLARRRKAAQAERLERLGLFRDITHIKSLDPALWLDSTRLPRLRPRPDYLRLARRHLDVFRDDLEARRAWRDSLAALAALADRCAARAIPLAVVLCPDHLQVSEPLRAELAREHGIDWSRLDLEAPQRRLAAFCAERAIPCLDLLPDFRAAARDRPDPKDDLYYPDDNHWSGHGNELAAQLIARDLAPRLEKMRGRAAQAGSRTSDVGRRK